MREAEAPFDFLDPGADQEGNEGDIVLVDDLCSKRKLILISIICGGGGFFSCSGDSAPVVRI